MARRLILGVLMTLLGVSALALAQTEMTMAEYEAKIAECRGRQRAADSTRAVAEQRTAELQQEVGDLQAKVVETNHQVLELVNADSAGTREYVSQLDAIVQQLRAMRQLGPNQIVDAREAGDIDRIEGQLNELKQNLLASLPESQQRIVAAERLIGELRNVQRPAPVIRRDQYVVENGDYLWRIAKKPTIYGDPLAWVKLYSANQDLVGENPNMIYPDWVIGVPRNQAPGTYWVQSGDNLSGIADQVYGDRTMWTTVWRANRDLITNVGGDEYTVYPHMVLDVPQQ